MKEAFTHVKLALGVMAYAIVFTALCLICVIPVMFLTLGRGRKWSDGVYDN